MEDLDVPPRIPQTFGNVWRSRLRNRRRDREIVSCSVWKVVLVSVFGVERARTERSRLWIQRSPDTEPSRSNAWRSSSARLCVHSRRRHGPPTVGDAGARSAWCVAAAVLGGEPRRGGPRDRGRRDVTRDGRRAARALARRWAQSPPVPAPTHAMVGTEPARGDRSARRRVEDVVVPVAILIRAPAVPSVNGCPRRGLMRSCLPDSRPRDRVVRDHPTPSSRHSGKSSARTPEDQVVRGCTDTKR